MNSKFKVGDRVKVVHTGSGFASRNLGNVYTIEEYNPNGYFKGTGYLVEETKNHGISGWIGEISFELVKPSPLFKHVEKPFSELIIFDMFINNGKTYIKTATESARRLSIDPASLGHRVEEFSKNVTHIEGLTWKDIYDSILEIAGTE